MYNESKYAEWSSNHMPANYYFLVYVYVTRFILGVLLRQAI